MATLKQKKAFNIMLEALQKGEDLTMKEIMERAGYKKSCTLKPKTLTERKGWQELLAQIDDQKLLDKLYEIALDKKDKRANIEAIKELFKLKDRYPAEKTKIQALFANIKEREEK